MKSYYHLIHFWMLAAVLGGSVSAEEEPTDYYPFKVSIGEQEAVLATPGDLFAVIAKPVKSDDLLKIAKAAEVLIANASPCKEDGTIVEGDKVLSIFGQNTDSLKLVATIKNEPLKPGTYLLNVVAHDKTSRLIFTIADPEGKMKFPKVSDVLKYLKGQS